MLKNTLAAFAFGAETLFAGSAAMAAPAATSCSSFTPNVTSYVTNTSACYVLSDTANDNVNSSADFNATNFGGHSDWTMIEKIDPYGVGTNFEITGNAFDGGKLLKGAWEVYSNAVTSAYAELVLLFKAGNANNTNPGNEVGYILSGDSGTWESMIFGTTGQKKAKGMSHVILLGRGACNPQTDSCGPNVGVVPVPAGLPLMLSALGLGVAVRRFKKRG